jgi:methyl-accepting chemotaxis protein
MEAFARTVSRSYYRKLFIYTLVIVVSGALCLGLGMLVLFPPDLGNEYGAALRTLHVIRQGLAGRVAGLYALAAFFLVSASAFLHLFFSHRIAGPAFRLRKEAEQIGQGNLKATFQLRPGDHLSDVADALKKTASRYGKTVDALEQHARHVASRAEAMSGMLGRVEDVRATEQAVADMARAAKDMEALLAEIKTC